MWFSDIEPAVHPWPRRTRGAFPVAPEATGKLGCFLKSWLSKIRKIEMQVWRDDEWGASEWEWGAQTLARRANQSSAQEFMWNLADIVFDLWKSLIKHEESLMKNMKNLEDWESNQGWARWGMFFLLVRKESYNRLQNRAETRSWSLVIAVTERFRARVRSFECSTIKFRECNLSQKEPVRVHVH